MTLRLIVFVGCIVGSVVMTRGALLARDKAPDRLPAEPAAAASPAASPLAALSLERFSVTRERPLFSPNRRPPPVPPAPVVSRPSPPAPPKVTLLGTVMDADEARALVSVGTPDKMLRVRIGDEIEGWKVTQIEQRSLVLSLDNRTTTFTLFSGQGASVGKLQPLSAPVGRQRGD
jgi:hypothetical protein